jgi:hypothetical protein
MGVALVALAVGPGIVEQPSHRQHARTPGELRVRVGQIAPERDLDEVCLLGALTVALDPFVDRQQQARDTGAVVGRTRLRITCQ